MNNICEPQIRTRGIVLLGHIIAIACFVFLPGLSNAQYSLDFDCGQSKAIDAVMIGTSDSVEATIYIPGDTSAIDSILVEIVVKGNPVFWGSTTLTTSAGEVVVIPFPGLITNTGSNEEGALYRAWVGSCQSIHATSPVVDTMHYFDWMSMTAFMVQNDVGCVSGSSSGGDILIFHACDTFNFIVDSVTAPLKDVKIIAPISEIGDADTVRTAIISVNYMHEGVLTNVSIDTFTGADNHGDFALLFETEFQIPGDVDSIVFILISPDGVFSNSSCTQQIPFGGDSFIMGTMVVSSSCEECCIVEINCDTIPDAYVCAFDLVPPIPAVLLDSTVTYDGNMNLDSLAFVAFGGTYTTTFCDTVYIIGSDEITGGGCPGDTGFVFRSFVFYSFSTGLPVNTCGLTYVVLDSLGPDLTCPGDTALQCTIVGYPAYTTFTAFVAAGGSATDDCALDESSFSLLSEVSDGQICPETITRTYSIADSCGNTGTCVQLIMLIDTIPPSITCPIDVALECTESTDPINTGTATATDDCDSAPVITYTDAVLSGACPQAYTITRTWFAIDACGNVASCTQRVDVSDTTAPEISAIACPGDITIQCDEDIPVAPDLTAMTSDNCDPSPTVTYVETSTQGMDPDSCDYYTYTLTRSWTPVDACGNIGTACIQIITVEDTTAPEISAIACPADITIECDDEIPVAPDLTPMTSDNCDLNPGMINNTPNTQTQTRAIQVFYEEDVTQGLSTEECSFYSYTITRTWTPVDACGNVGTACVQIITVVDTTAPMFTLCPADITLNSDENCIVDITPPNTNGPATATDNCSGVTIAFFDISAQTADGTCSDYTYVITRTWTAFDVCGNATQCPQMITVQDITPPSITCAADVTLECTESTDPMNTGFPIVTDNCDGAPFVTYADVSAPGACPQAYTITRTWLAQDICGNAATCVQLIDVVDTTPPNITCPADVALECLESTDPANTGTATATDNCDTDVDITYTDVITPGDCPQAYTIARTWIAADDCGNVSTCVQMIAVDDTTPPNIICPADVTLECTESTDPANTGTATATDNCDLDVAVTYTDLITPGNCPQAYTIARTWIASDDCGNVTTCVQTITVDDTTPPVLSCPGDITFDCSIGTPFFTSFDEFVAGGGSASDNCALDPSSFILLSGVGVGPCPTTFTYVYQIADSCGNIATCAQQVLVVDETPPMITCPGDVQLQCGIELPAYASVIEFVAAGGNIIDDCSIDTMSFMVSEVSDGETCPETITRTYSISDFCGNVATCVQTIIVDDTTPPTITCPVDITIECSDPIPPGIISVADNCDTDLDILPASSISQGNCPDEFIIFRTWTVIDDCGNSAFCSQTVTILDTTPPSITCPADVSLECTESTETNNTGVATAIDNCDSAPLVTYSDVQTPGACPQQYTITRTWLAQDACGNVATCVQTINVDDTTPPSITCPGGVMLECSDSTDPANTGLATATDNCDPEPFVTYTDAVTPGACPYNYTITRTWSAEDACGNIAACVQTISVDDTTPPSITCPADLTISCEEATDPANTGTPIVADNCDIDPFITFFDGVEGGNCDAESIIFRQWVVTDACGNLASCLQTISVVDTTAPMAICPPDVTVECEANIPACPADIDAFIALGGSVTDNCSVDLNFSCSQGQLVGGSCGGTVTYTFSFSDECGNSSSCSWVVTVDDNTPPEIVCPANVTLGCDALGEEIVWSDNFDSYATGSQMHGQGGWKGWDNSPAGGALTSSVQAHSAPNSVDILGASDLVHEYSGYTSGQWTYTAWQYVPNGFSGLSYFILLNTYSDGGPYNWSVQVAFNSATAQVENSGISGGTLALITGQWVEIRVEIDLDADTQNFYYNNQLLYSGTWTGEVSGGGALNIGAVDMFANNATSVYYDDMTLTQEGVMVGTGMAEATDNCDPDPEVSFEDVITDGNCPQEYTVTRTWTAVDDCGNSAQCVQVIQTVDDTPPTIECPMDITLTGPTDIDPNTTGTPETEDNCDGDVSVDFDDVIIPGECDEQFVAERTWTATDACGNTATCLQIITVEFDCICELVCPPNITINLDPGACDAIISYPDPTFDGGACPMEIMEPVSLTQNVNTTLIQDALACTGAGDSHWRAYDLAAMGVTDDFQMNSLGMLSWSAGTIQVFVYSYTGPMPPAATLDVAQMTLMGQSAPTAVGGFAQTTISLTAPLLIPAGTNIAVEQRIVAGLFSVAGNYAGNSQPAYIQAAPCGAPVPTSYPTIGFGQIHPVQVLNGVLLQQGGLLVQTEGLPSGSAFPIGTTTNCFDLVNAQTGEIVNSCCFDVVVNEYPFSIQPTCNNLVQVSLDENCEARICADIILEGGPYGCYDDYLVYVDQYGFGNNINCQSLTFTYGLHTVTITDPETGNSCWGQILIEDKLPPTLECQDFTLSCGQDLTPVFTPPIQGVSTCATILNPGLPIGPNAGVITTSTCTVSLPQGVEIVDVNVCVKITHTWIGDCNTDIISPAGAVTNLWGFGQCGSTDNMHQKFDDDGPLTVLCADINNGCDFLLEPVAFQLGTPTLAQYNTENPNGVWTLMITDNAGGDGGTLDEWYLEIEYAQNAPFAPTVSDNCDTDVTLVWSDSESGELCENTIIERTWTATDDAGNTAQCVQTLTIEPLTLAALECPATYIGSCGESSHPNVTGWPTIDGVPITEGGICNIFVGYWDQELADCGNGLKIVRRWTILDWCTQEVEECVQIIKLTDDQGPVLTCPANITVGTDPWFCNRDVNLSVPQAYDACQTPFTLTPTISAGILVHFGGNNYRGDNLPLGITTVTWTAVDACGNSSTCSYTITVVDDVPPVPICDEHTVVSLTTDNGLNEGLTKIYATTFDDGSYDNCGPVTFLARRMDSCIDFDWIGPNGEYPNNDGGLPESLDRGLTFQPWVPFACCDVGNTVMVELRVTDASGNINSCMVEVEVQDKLPPYIACPPDITLSCSFWFDGHETNGFEATDGLESIFGRVLDAYDYDDADRGDIIINDPENNQVSQPHFWGRDGWADDNCDVEIDVRTRIFDDCSGDDLPSGAPANAVRLVERTFRAQDAQGNTSTCRQRVWVVDFHPFYITDTQCGLNNADDVRWPCDLLLTDCPAGELTPENLSGYAPNNAPVVKDDNCSIVGMTYDDQIFYFVDNACYKIVRTWTVIDWCQFDPVEHTGYWTYVQVIKVFDEDGPEFDCPDGPLTYCVADDNVELPSNNQVYLGEGNPNSSACSAHVWESREVYETCSDVVIYDVKIYPHNGSEYVQIVAPTTVPVTGSGSATLTWDTRQNSLPSNHPIRKYGLDYNNKVCSNWPLSGGTKDYYRVLWSVEDGCGNTNSCEYLFRLEDCKQPSPVCVGLSSVVMPIGGEVTIWAKDFDQSSYDDCTAHEDLLFSFSGDVYEPYRVYDCAAIEANGSPSFLEEIWVADEGNDQNCSGFVNPLGIEWSERNKDYCTTFIVIDDNEGACGDSLTGGLVETEIYEAVENVKVTLTDPNGQIVNTFITDKNGLYHFINPLFDYTIEPERNDNHKNGVSTLDLVAIQKHLLGLQPLTSPYKMIAADANNSKSVSALDLVEIRKLILGLYTEFPKNTSWRFVDSEFEFADPSYPWPFDEVIESHGGMTMHEDFVAVKVGDVNGTVVANATQITTRGARNVLKLQVEDQKVQEGETIEVPVTSENYSKMIGYQFTLDLKGLEYAGIRGGAITMQTEFVGVHKEAITMSWGDVKSLTTPTDEVLFTLKFNVTKNGSLKEMMKITSAITEAEAYSLNAEDAEIFDVELVFGKTEVQTTLEYALYQNEPNPFADQAIIGFELPAAMPATLTVYDLSGRVVHVVEGEYAEGYNKIVLKRKDLVADGAYYYHLQAGDFTASKKMILSK